MVTSLWKQKASDEVAVELIYSFDDDDKTVPDEVPRPEGWKVVVVQGPNRHGTDAFNAGAREATGKAYIQMHDDVEPPPCWDKKVVELLGPEIDNPWVMGVDDGGYGMKNKVCCVLVCTAAWVKHCGYMYYPEYIAMYADDDITQKARLEGRLLEYWDKIRFRHAWQKWGKDDTWHRENREESWDVGRELLERRKAEGFPSL